MYQSPALRVHCGKPCHSPDLTLLPSQAAEYALSCMESRGGRKSLSSVDDAKLQLVREEMEGLQMRVQGLQDELEGAREEQRFGEARGTKLEGQVAELEAKLREADKLAAATKDANDVQAKLAAMVKEMAEREKELVEGKKSLAQSQSAYEAAAKELQIVSEVPASPACPPYWASVDGFAGGYLLSRVPLRCCARHSRSSRPRKLPWCSRETTCTRPV